MGAWCRLLNEYKDKKQGIILGLKIMTMEVNWLAIMDHFAIEIVHPDVCHRITGWRFDWSNLEDAIL